MKHTFKYILSTFVLLVPVLAHAQTTEDELLIYTNGTGTYHRANGIATAKSVSAPTTTGKYTLTLETFATGATSFSRKALPSDVVLVLDLSTSMGGHRGELTELETPISLSYNDVMNLDEDGDCYVRWYDGHGFGYEVLGIQRGGRYYLYWLNPSTSNNRGVTFFDKNGGESGTGTDNVTTATLPTPAADYSTTDPDEKFWTFPAGTSGTDHPVDPYNATNPEHANYCHATVHKATNARLRELKQSTLAFIDEIVNNDRYINGDPAQGARPDGRLGNRLSIVAFGGSVITDYSTDLLTLTDDNITTLQNLVKSFTMRTGTNPTDALSAANTRLTNRADMTVGEDFFRTVVFFTDGKPDPSGNPNFNGAIAQANTIKNNKSATIYSVGLFSGGDLKNYPRIPEFMSHVSSEWFNSTTLDNGTQNDDGVQYYHDASDDDMSLSEIFQTIASASGGSEKTVPASTVLVDAVSSSFEVPSSFEASDVVVYTRPINAAGSAWGEKVPLTKVILPESFNTNALPPSNAEYMTDEGKVGVYLYDGKLMVLGFNYSKGDSEGANGTTDHPFDGNWVGYRYVDNEPICAGNELVIEFEIEAVDDVTGGNGTNTNSPESGVLVPQYDDDGNFTGYKNENKYPYPQTDLPINLIIQKEGLRHGESATVQIYRAKQRTGGDEDDFHSVTGKPLPNVEHAEKPSPTANNYYVFDEWENFSKVILTNKGKDGDTVTKTLLSLDPTYVYLLAEDNWGFGYQLSETVISTADKEANPFIFVNTKLAIGSETDLTAGTVVKHAEAVSINHFGTNARREDFKSNEKFDQ